MYAAAGGASLASRQARRNVRKQHHVVSSDAVHQQFQRRFQQLHQEHARLYTDLNGRIPAPCDVEGKAAAAWSERERRSSAAECSLAQHHHHHRVKLSDNHRKWTRRNRIHDSSFGGSSSEEEEPPGGVYRQSAAANALLYVGLGTVAIGLVIAFVGTGEKGFKTLELRLIGPTLIGSGVLCCLVRVFLCICPSRCRRRGRRKRGPQDNDYYRHLPYNARTARDFMPTAGGVADRSDKKRVSIVPAPFVEDRKPLDDRRSAAARVPLPNFIESPAGEENPIEMKRLEGADSFDDLPSVSSEDGFEAHESLALVEGSNESRVVKNAADVERMARLRSTLTFQEEGSADRPRIEEEDSETTDAETPPATPAPILPLPRGAECGRELVLSPAKLQNV